MTSESSCHLAPGISLNPEMEVNLVVTRVQSPTPVSQILHTALEAILSQPYVKYGLQIPESTVVYTELFYRLTMVLSYTRSNAKIHTRLQSEMDVNCRNVPVH